MAHPKLALHGMASEAMTRIHLKALLAVTGLLAFVALLICTVFLAQTGQPIWAGFTGTGAVAVGIGGLYKLLLFLGRTP